MKPLATAKNIVPNIARIALRLERDRIVFTDDAFWVGAAAAEINLLLRERDEVRRALCIAMADDITSAAEFAEQRGWDCFAGRISDVA